MAVSAEASGNIDEIRVGWLALGRPRPAPQRPDESDATLDQRGNAFGAFQFARQGFTSRFGERQFTPSWNSRILAMAYTDVHSAESGLTDGQAWETGKREGTRGCL
jgi:hypothetical protein